MAGTYVMTPEFARNIMQSILDERRRVEEKSVMQLEALNLGACALERANENGALLHQEAAIVRYHACHKGASIFTDERTRRALKAAVARLNREIAREGADADE